MQADPPSDADFYDEEMSESPPDQSQPYSPGPSQNEPNENDKPSENNENDKSNENDKPNETNETNEIPGDVEMEPGDVEMEDPPVPSQSSLGGLSGRSSPTSPRSQDEHDSNPDSNPGREPGTWAPNHIRIQDSVTDAIRYPLCMERFYHPNGLMQPRDQDLSSLDANGKTWVMERPPLSLQIDGNTWSFVDQCHAGITGELLKVLYLFDMLNGMSNYFHWNGFVVATTDISGCNQSTFLQPSFAPNNKDINGVMLNQFMEPDGSISFKGSNNGVDTGKLLSSSELSASGIVYTPLDLFRISISFTAAVFESSRVKRKGRREARDPDDSDDEDESRQAIFGVVTVTALKNVDTLKLIMVWLAF